MKVIGIFGSSASGKSTLANRLKTRLNASLLYMDNYYKSYSELEIDERKKLDFANPIHYDIQLLCKHIKLLKLHQPIQTPSYSFELCTRNKTTETIIPNNILLIEGYGLLTFKELRKQLDFCFYIDADEQTKINRMLERDVKQRGCSKEKTLEKYYNSVLPNYKKFVLPYVKYANDILDGTKPLEKLEKQCLNVLEKILGLGGVNEFNRM